MTKSNYVIQIDREALKQQLEEAAVVMGVDFDEARALFIDALLTGYGDLANIVHAPGTSVYDVNGSGRCT